MSRSVLLYTPYPGVNQAVQLLLETVQETLGKYFVGLYLHGSLASGDFNLENSDIDFVVVTTQELPDKMIPMLEAAHQRVWASKLEWSTRLEGSYFPLKSYYRHNPGDPPRPHVYQEKFFISRQETDWIINRHILRETGVVISGPPLKPMIAPILKSDIRWTVVEGLRTDWAPRLNNREWITPPQNQNFVVLTNCRALYTLKYGTLKSKPASARWALKALGRRWRDLIEYAMTWQRGMPPGDLEKTLEMMRYAWGIAQTYVSKVAKT
jgi:hypothetical protein